MARIVITGATGLVGSHLVPLLAPEDELHLIVRQPADAPGGPNIHVHKIDLSQPIDDSGLPAEIDSVIYLAQSEAYRDFPGRALDVFDVNVAGLMHLLDYARRAGATSFVSASSGAVYGPSRAVRDEAATVAATGRLGFYASSKLCGEILAEAYGGLMSVTVLRLFFVYGRGQARSMLIPRLVETIRQARAVSLAGDEGIRINPVHASDAASACKAALELDGAHTINVAGPEVLSLRRICEIIGARLGLEPQFEHPSAPASDFVADTRLMTRLLGAPKRRFEDGIGDLL